MRFNEGLDEVDQFNNIKKLFKDKIEYKTNRMHKKAEEWNY